MVEGALKQKKEDWSKIQRKNTKIRGKNTFPLTRSLARPVPTCGTAVPVPRATFTAFSSRTSYPVAALLFYPFSCLVSKSIVKL